jgi:lysophospholipase L1-like esterase
MSNERKMISVFVSVSLCLCGLSIVSYAQSNIPANQPLERTDSNSQLAHQQLLEKGRRGRIDVFFLGDSITRRWGATDYPDFLANWKQNFFGWNAANFGWGGDTTQNILWRLENGELDGVNPKVIVILAGTNNVGRDPGDDARVADITRGIQAIIDLCQRKAPRATIILTAIFPRNDNLAVIPTINRINENIAAFADGKKIRFLNINNKLAGPDGVLFEGVTVDKLHLSLKGYQIWADALKPLLRKILGPPSARDQAPPPTGDPSKSPVKKGKLGESQNRGRNPIEVASWRPNDFYVAQAFRGCVRTASGSDRIRKNCEIHLGADRCNPFPRGFVFSLWRLPDPVATARGSDTPSTPGAGKTLRWNKVPTAKLVSLKTTNFPRGGLAMIRIQGEGNGWQTIHTKTGR